MYIYIHMHTHICIYIYVSASGLMHWRVSRLNGLLIAITTFLCGHQREIEQCLCQAGYVLG